MSKSKIKSRKTWGGDIIHEDEDGNVVGRSRENFWGDIDHYDADGNKVGTSYEGIFGDTVFRNADGSRGTSTELFGSVHYLDDYGRSATVDPDIISDQTTWVDSDDNYSFFAAGVEELKRNKKEREAYEAQRCAEEAEEIRRRRAQEEAESEAALERLEEAAENEDEETFEEYADLLSDFYSGASDIPRLILKRFEEEGLDYDALCEVNEAERREAFENADLDYDAYALYFEHVDEAFNEDETLEFSVDFEWEEAPNEKATEQMQRSKLKSCGLNEFKLRAMKEKDRMALVRKAGLDAKEYEIYLFSCEPDPEICSAALAEAGLDAELLRCLPSDMRMARIAEKGYDPEDFEYGFFAECTLLGIFAEELLDVGLDYEELQLLPEKKRRNAITNAGLDPDRYLPLFQGIHEESALIRELASAGLFYGLLCGMDPQKRRAAIEEKGLDAEDYAAIFPKKGE